MSFTLHDITADYKRLLILCEEEDLDDEVVRGTMEAIEGEFEVKADAYAVVMAELKADVSKLDEEIKRLQNRKNVIENNIGRMKTALMGFMETSGKTKFKTDYYSFSIAKNGGIQPMEIVGDVPDDYMKIKKEPDNDRIRELLMTGQKCDWAELKPYGTHLNIR